MKPEATGPYTTPPAPPASSPGKLTTDIGSGLVKSKRSRITRKFSPMNMLLAAITIMLLIGAVVLCVMAMKN
ncbi:MAG: hypothetical protein ACREFE_09390 [Limisphaerales bacterium]